MDEAMNESSKKNWWVWLVVAAVAVALAVFYLRSSAPAPTDNATKALEEVGISDEVGSIDQDLGATDLSGLDKELGNIEAELGQP